MKAGNGVWVSCGMEGACNSRPIVVRVGSLRRH